MQFGLKKICSIYGILHLAMGLLNKNVQTIAFGDLRSVKVSQTIAGEQWHNDSVKMVSGQARR